MLEYHENQITNMEMEAIHDNQSCNSLATLSVGYCLLRRQHKITQKELVVELKSAINVVSRNEFDL